MTHTPAGRAPCVAAFVICLWAAGCAGIGMFEPSAPRPGAARTPAGEALAPQAAMRSIAIGRSTKADIAHALGAAIVIPFDSGYEVWVYRWPGAEKTTRAATELVVLFSPSGLVTKARLRPGYTHHPPDRQPAAQQGEQRLLDRDDDGAQRCAGDGAQQVGTADDVCDTR